MNLSISNIGWAAEDDDRIYALMQKYGFTGLEIAPTRIFSSCPYSSLIRAKEWMETLHATQGLTISSMQSIWYGRSEKIFGSDDEREALIAYTKEANIS